MSCWSHTLIACILLMSFHPYLESTLSQVPSSLERMHFTVNFTAAASISSIFGKSRENQNMVDYRVRAFGNFLQIVLQHPILRLDHVFHLFISKADATWKMEIVKYTMDPLRPIAPTKMPKNMDSGLRSIYDILGSFEEKAKQLNTQQKLILRKLKEIQTSFEGLGSQYNSFSLEFELLAPLLDSVGELHDSDAYGMGEVVGRQELLCEMAHDLNLYICAVKRALSYFMGMLVELEVNQEITNELRAGILEAKEADPNASSLPLKEEYQKALSRRVEKNRENLWAELGVWLQRIRGQWHAILLQLSQSQVKSLESSLSNWSNFQKQ